MCREWTELVRERVVTVGSCAEKRHTYPLNSARPGVLRRHDPQVEANNGKTVFIRESVAPRSVKQRPRQTCEGFQGWSAPSEQTRETYRECCRRAICRQVKPLPAVFEALLMRICHSR